MSLIEAMVWIMVLVSAMVALSSTVLYFYRTSHYALEEASAVASAQHGIDLMIRTMREASYASNGAYPIVSIGPNDVKFYADIDPDSGVEQVRYFLSGTNLMKGIVEPTGDPSIYTSAESDTLVSENLRNAAQGVAVFTYYDKNGAQIINYAKIAEVRFITANISVDVDPFRTPTPISLKSSAALRNLIGQ